MEFLQKPNYLPVSSSSSRPGKKIAIFLGVNQYQDPFWPSLKWAQKDVEDLKEKKKASVISPMPVKPATPSVTKKATINAEIVTAL